MKMLEKFNELYNKIISEDTEWKDNAQFEKDNKFLLNTKFFSKTKNARSLSCERALCI